MQYSLVGISRDWREPSATCIGLVTAAFWIFSYLLLTFWARVLVEQPYPLLSLRRTIAVSAGAFIYWMVLRRIAHSEGETRLNPLKILAAIVPAGLGLLAVRVIIDALLFFDSPLSASANIRWVLVWTGYFGLWVTGALAFRMQDSFRRQTPCATRPAEAASVPAVIAAPIVADREAQGAMAADWEWVVRVMADELGELAETDRAAVAEKLMARGGYHLAPSDDPETIAHNRRVDLVHRLAARLARDAG